MEQHLKPKLIREEINSILTKHFPRMKDLDRVTDILSLFREGKDYSEVMKITNLNSNVLSGILSRLRSKHIAELTTLLPELNTKKQGRLGKTESKKRDTKGNQSEQIEHRETRVIPDTRPKIHIPPKATLEEIRGIIKNHKRYAK